ncbi:hypothetical protein EJB05_32765, partial [Eragrostis curvula]
MAGLQKLLRAAPPASVSRAERGCVVAATAPAPEDSAAASDPRVITIPIYYDGATFMTGGWRRCFSSGDGKDSAAAAAVAFSDSEGVEFGKDDEDDEPDLGLHRNFFINLPPGTIWRARKYEDCVQVKAVCPGLMGKEVSVRDNLWYFVLNSEFLVLDVWCENLFWMVELEPPLAACCNL